jgi:glycosyltransferase involved in cell wall biosynthesis
MQQDNSFILWLPSWYPNRLKPFDGDFIQRHAQAAALYSKIYVIKIVADEAGTVTNDVKTDISTQGNLTEEIIYYKKTASFFGIPAAYRAMRLYRHGIKKCISKNGRPRFVHIHVGMRAGLWALWVKRKYGIPFVLTEHWAGFSPEARKNFKSLSLFLRNFWKRVITRATNVSSVSVYLGDLLKKQFALDHYTVIPNVVNANIFYPVNKIVSTVPRFIHVSGLDYQKNPEAILRAFAILRQSSTDFHLDIFGPEKIDLVAMAGELQIQQQVTFHNEVPQSELAKYVAQSDALILYSRYESFGCVIIEANACGVPALVSDLAVFHETIQHGTNGLFIKGDDPPALAGAIRDVIERKYRFDKMAIAKMTYSKFSYEVVGKQFNNWYKKLFDY